MSTFFVKCSLIVVTVSLLIVVNAIPSKLRECELANIFFHNGFSQYQTRFSVCYAKSKNFIPKSVTPYRHNETSKAIFFFGMFPITTPFCGDAYEPERDSVCGISCKYTLDYKLENEVLCMKHVFDAKLSETVESYMKKEEENLTHCMRTIFDGCHFTGPGGQTSNGEPIFLG